MSKVRAYKRKYHFIYKTTCLITNKFYYGMHSTDNLDDGYLGSGKRLWYSIRKHGKENHKIERLEFFETREELAKKEEGIVNEELLNDPLCINLQPGGGGGWSSEDHRANNIKSWNKGGNKAFKEKLKNPKFYKKFCDNRKKQWEDEEYRKNITEKCRIASTGKKHSKETIEKIKNADRTGCKNSQYGTCWITNEKENKKIHKGDTIPEGWRLGRKIKYTNLTVS